MDGSTITPINFDEANDEATVGSIDFNEDTVSIEFPPEETVDYAGTNDTNDTVNFGSDQAPIVDATFVQEKEVHIDFGIDKPIADNTAPSIDFDQHQKDLTLDSKAYDYEEVNQTASFGPDATFPALKNNEAVDLSLDSKAYDNEEVDQTASFGPDVTFLALKRNEAIEALVKFLSATSKVSKDGTDEELYEFLMSNKELDKNDNLRLSNITLQSLDALLELLFSDDLPFSVFESLEDHLQSKLGNDDATKNPLFYRIGQSLINVIKDKKPSKRVPLISLVVKNATREEAQKALNTKITKREWSNANTHFMYPGPGEPLPEQIACIRRKRVRDDTITDFVEWLYASDLLESLSFGQKVVKFSNGFHFAIESIKRTDSFAAIIRRYARKWMIENADANEVMGSEGSEVCCNINSEGKRCSREEDHDGSCNFASERSNKEVESDECGARCKKSDAPCFKKKNHEGNHAYTPENKLSPSTIARILATLTNGEIKSLAGLDNIDVIKGHDNFENMREMVKKLVYIGRMDAGSPCKEADLLLENIDASEKFHKLIFPQHLGKPGSKHKCTCIQCGLSHDRKDPIKCPIHGDHSPPCKDCQLSFSMIGDLYDFHEVVFQKLKKNGTFIVEPCLEDDLDTWRDSIKRYHTYLLDYRSHIVHKEDEGIFDANHYRDLDEDECIIIFDYKVSWHSSYNEYVVKHRIHFMIV